MVGRNWKPLLIGDLGNLRKLVSGATNWLQDTMPSYIQGKFSCPLHSIYLQRTPSSLFHASLHHGFLSRLREFRHTVQGISNETGFNVNHHERDMWIATFQTLHNVLLFAWSQLPINILAYQMTFILVRRCITPGNFPTYLKLTNDLHMSTLTSLLRNDIGLIINTSTLQFIRPVGSRRTNNSKTSISSGELELWVEIVWYLTTRRLK